MISGEQGWFSPFWKKPLFDWIKIGNHWFEEEEELKQRLESLWIKCNENSMNQ